MFVSSFRCSWQLFCSRVAWHLNTLDFEQLFNFGCYFQTIFPNTAISDIWAKCSSVTKPKGLSLFPSFSLVSLSLSANGCGLLKGAVEGSAWIFYPDKVQGRRVALSHVLRPAWIKRTHIDTHRQELVHSPLPRCLTTGIWCALSAYWRMAPIVLWPRESGLFPGLSFDVCLIIVFTHPPRLIFVYLLLYTSVALALGPDGHVPSLAPTCTVNEDTENESKQQISSPKVNVKRYRQSFQPGHSFMLYELWTLVILNNSIYWYS